LDRSRMGAGSFQQPEIRKAAGQGVIRRRKSVVRAFLRSMVAAQASLGVPASISVHQFHNLSFCESGLVLTDLRERNWALQPLEATRGQRYGTSSPTSTIRSQ